MTINRQPVQYKGEDLAAERGPGLGCFRFQLIVLVALVVLTPLTVAWGWAPWISAALLFAVIALLLVAGQTIIFLLRLVAADRRSRRRPLGSATKTVGELEDERRAGETPAGAADPTRPGESSPSGGSDAPEGDGPDGDAPEGDAREGGRHDDRGTPPTDEGAVRQ